MSLALLLPNSGLSSFDVLGRLKRILQDIARDLRSLSLSPSGDKEKGLREVSLRVLCQKTIYIRREEGEMGSRRDLDNFLGR